MPSGSAVSLLAAGAHVRTFLCLGRIAIYAGSIVVFSTCTIVMGSAQEVWQLIILRFGVALG